ncbi:MULTISPECIES: 3-oxoadipate enol-lactonase [Xanthobacter]|uniref:3-oxoadipate enol-lactonase n=1 Tax=Xanthobacter TaxID=279 RepID=UPI001F1B2CB3|nr:MULTISPECIES: 3-oxoadipate enol-lactonase [unclassified Xanthobacter]
MTPPAADESIGHESLGYESLGYESLGHVTLGDGCRLAYRFDGPADAPVLLLSHALGTRLEMWDPQIPALAETFRVLRYDCRGHGRSDVPVGAYGMDRLGRDVVELMDTLSVEHVHFCGLSLGGMVGQWLAARVPERVTGLVLANTTAHMGLASVWDERINAVLDGGVAALTESVLMRWFTPAFLAAHPERVAPVRAMLNATAAEGYAGCCAAIRDMDLRLTAPLIRAPTLVIVGTQDPSTPPEEGLRLAQSIASAHVAKLDCAHLSNVEQADAFTELLLAHCGAGA